MSLMSLPNELLTIIFRHVAVNEEWYMRDFNNLASTCKRLLGIASMVRKYLPRSICRPRSLYVGTLGHCDSQDRLTACYRKLPAHPNPCPLHTADDGYCNYNSLVPLFGNTIADYSCIEFGSVNFRSSYCILAADKIKWDNITGLELGSCSIDCEILGKLLTKLTHLIDLDISSVDYIRPRSPHRGPALIRKSLREITFRNDSDDIASEQCFYLPARRVNINLARPGDNLPNSYLARYRDKIEFLRIDMITLTTSYHYFDYKPQLRQLGLEGINYEVYNDDEGYMRLEDCNCNQYYNCITNEYTYGPYKWTI